MPLTDRQDRIRHFVARFIDLHGYGPTVREIAAACDISSTSVVSYNLRRLAQLGHLSVDDGISRGVTTPTSGGLIGQPPANDPYWESGNSQPWGYVPYSKRRTAERIVTGTATVQDMEQLLIYIRNGLHRRALAEPNTDTADPAQEAA